MYYFIPNSCTPNFGKWYKIRKNLLTIGAIQKWSGLPQEVVCFLSLEVFKPRLDDHLSGMLEREFLFGYGLDKWPLTSLPTLKFCDSLILKNAHKTVHPYGHRPNLRVRF